MKTALYSVCCLLLLGIRVDPASGTIITVNLYAHVTQLSDPSGVLARQIVMGQAITGTYTYDTSTPDVGAPGSGWYLPVVPPGNVSVSAGTLLFQTVPLQVPNPLAPPLIQVNVNPAPNGGYSYFRVLSSNNQLLNAGVPVAHIDSLSFNFADLTGQWPASDALPSGVPPQKILGTGVIIIQSASANIQVMAQIDSVALVPPTFAVSPDSGSFLPTQRFGATVLLPVGAQVVTMQASLNGYSLPPFSYPGTCTLSTVQLTNQQAILCPYASMILMYPPPPAALQPGQPLPITWQVTLADGTVINKTVTWTPLLP